MSCVNCEPCMPRFDLVTLSSQTVSGTSVRSQGAHTVYDRNQATENGLKVLIFDQAWIEAEVLTNRCPERSQILFRWPLKFLIFDVNFA